jgi:hypothetical protein
MGPHPIGRHPSTLPLPSSHARGCQLWQVWRDTTRRFESLKWLRRIGSGGFANVWMASVSADMVRALDASKRGTVTAATPAQTEAASWRPDAVAAPAEADAADAASRAAASYDGAHAYVAVKVFERHAYANARQLDMIAQELSLMCAPHPSHPTGPHSPSCAHTTPHTPRDPTLPHVRPPLLVLASLP